ncbi:hypothetical protein ACM66B_004205 [Microbotryomycetes sp. NB124-2]
MAKDLYSLDDRLKATLESRAQRRMLRTLEPNPAITQADPPLVDFSSNDYLSLGRSQELKQNLVQQLDQLSTSPYGPPSSRLLDGNSRHHLDLETRLATFFRAETGLLFNSGYDANVGAWSCLPSSNDWIVYDSLIHASVHDGMRASRVDKRKRVPFAHNLTTDLQRRLQDILAQDDDVKRGKAAVWIAIETLYSMDGDLAPVKDMLQVVERTLPKGNGHMVVDEAHSTGLYGPQGRGVVCALGLANRITVRVHTFGKAMACSGGIVLASPTLRSYLINYARPLIYSTAMPRMNVIAIRESFKMLESGQADQSAAHVHHLATTLIQRLSAFLSPTSEPISIPANLASEPAVNPSIPSTVTTITSTEPNDVQTTLLPMLATSPIVPLVTSEPHRLSRHLIENGFLVRPIAYPTVPKGQERVRVCLHAANTDQEVERLSECLRKWCVEWRRNVKLESKL